MFDYGKMKSGKAPFFLTKADLLLLIGILAAAFVLLFVGKVFRKPGSLALVSYGGQEIMQIPLAQEDHTDTRYYLIIWETEPMDETPDSEEGAARFRFLTLSPEKWEEEAEALIAENEAGEYNLFVCGDGEVRMLRSSCPDLICVRHKAVSEAGENIICLPHELVIEIAGAQEKELDGVAY